MCVVVFMSVLHYVKDVEYVSLVLQSRTLFQLPHQCCKVCVALRVPRQVQISSTVGLVRDVRVNMLKSQEKTRFLVEGSAASTLCCFTCEPCWGWGTSSRLRDLRCLLLAGVTGRYIEDSETHTLIKLPYYEVKQVTDKVLNRFVPTFPS